MFSFLNAVILLGLLGVGLPVLIHLFARQKLQRIEFSSTEFLKQIQIQKMRRVRLRQLILLILRCLAIFLLVVAFARPTIQTGSKFSESRAQSSAVLVTDCSMSMGRKDLFREAKQKAISVLDILSSGDEAALMWTVNTAEKEPSFKHEGYGLRQNISKKNVSWARGIILEKIEEAIGLLSKSHNLNREIFLVTDLQRSNFSNPSDTTQMRPWGGRIFILPVTGEQENVAVIDGGVENQILQPYSPIRVFAEVRNFGERRVEGLLIRVFLEGEAAAQKVVNLNSGESQRLSFRVVPKRTGWIWGSISIDDDSFLQDNELFFVCRIPELIRVTLAGKRFEDIYNFRLALNQREQKGKVFDVKEVFYGEEWIYQIDGSDVIFFSNYPTLNSNDASRLRQFVEDGGGVFFFLGDDVDLRSYNEYFFVPIAGVSLGNIYMGREKQGEYFTFGSIDFGHPLFEGIFKKGKESIRSPRFFRAVEILGKRYHNIISFEDGKPFLIEIVIEKGRILLATSGIRENWSDLMYSTIFAPIVYRSSAYLSTIFSEEDEESYVGESVSLLTDIEDMNATYYVEIPSGEEILLLPKVRSGKIMLEMTHLKKPGIYRFYKGKTLLGIKAVNIDSEESDLNPISEKELKERFPDTQLKIIRDEKNLEKVVSEARWGREFWREIILLVMLVLVIEMIIAREKRMM